MKLISSNEQIATSDAPRNDESKCHPEPVEGVYITEENEKSLRQACTERSRSTQTDIKNVIPHLVKNLTI